MKFILASSSPRRKTLLKELVGEFSVIEPKIDEKAVRALDAALPQEISKHKAYTIFNRHPDAVILACDTIVYHKGHKLGKPVDAESAWHMLKLLSGKIHKVITGYTLLGPDFEINRTVVTRVHFNELSDEMIADYIASGSPFDKAGGYGIQDETFPLVKKIEGSYSNVMGLPLEDLRSMFNKFNIKV